MSDRTLTIRREQQPPTKNNPEFGEGDGAYLESAAEPLDKSAEVKQLEQEVAQSQQQLDDKTFLDLSIKTYETYKQHFDTAVRPMLNDAIKSYRSQHTSNSAYGFDGSGENNSIYRPRIRTIIDKNKAVCDASFFTNMDVVSIEAENPTDKAEVITASLMKALINYRCLPGKATSLPWKYVCMGGFDAATYQGLTIAHTFWDIQRRAGKKIERPMVELVPLERLLFDPASDWTDIVNSSPALIYLKPMYVGDILEGARNGLFRSVTEDDIAGATIETRDETAKERNPSFIDPAKAGQGRKPTQYKVVMVQFHIHRIHGEDWFWYTLDNKLMLSDPAPLTDFVEDGERPFVIGCLDIEAFNAFVTSMAIKFLPLQEEMNILANQRRTNVDMAMNRKIVIDPSAGDEVDPTKFLDNDVNVIFCPPDKAKPWDVPDVTQSSYLEQQSLDADFNEAAGNFNPVNLTSQTNKNEAYRTQQMLNSTANMMVDSRLKTYAMTFIEPILQKVAKLERYYETDDRLLSLIGQRAGIFVKVAGRLDWSQKAKQIMNQAVSQHSPEDLQQIQQQAQGQQPESQAQPGPMQGMQPTQPAPGGVISGLSARDLLSKELEIQVNVGLNATSPDYKLQRFIAAKQDVLATFQNPAHTVFDMTEVAREEFSLSGYGDGGTRFFAGGDQSDPEKVMLQQRIMQLTMLLKEHGISDQTKLQIAREKNASQERINAAKLTQDANELRVDAATAVLEHSQKMAEQHQPQEPDANTPPPQGM